MNNLTDKIKSILKNEKYLQILKFALVGILNTLVDISVSYFLKGFLHFSDVICHIGGYSTGTLNSFFLNKFFTFKNTGNKQNSLHQFARFVITNLVTLVITTIALKFLIDVVLINFYISKVLVTVLSLSINFVSSKFWVFKKAVDKHG